MKPTSVTSSEVNPEERGALLSKESNITQYFYFWFSAFVSCVTFSFVYKIIQSSGLWRQPVLRHRCRASTHKLETIRLEQNTWRTTDRHTPYFCTLHVELNSYTTDLNTSKSTGLFMSLQG